MPACARACLRRGHHPVRLGLIYPTASPASPAPLALRRAPLVSSAPRAWSSDSACGFVLQVDSPLHHDDQRTHQSTPQPSHQGSVRQPTV